MDHNLQNWLKLYEELKPHALCIDIEVTHYNGPISVLGTYEPKDGEIHYNSFIKGHNLTKENLMNIFSKCKLLIVYNGLRFDIPKINEEFLGVIPKEMQILDIFCLARKIGLGTNLKILENTLGIERMTGDHKGKAIRLWQQYSRYQDKKALQMLLEYNKQDVINLYPIIEAIKKKTLTQSSIEVIA